MVSDLDRIRGINAQIVTLDTQIAQAEAEASMLEHIDDDAQRDAIVTESYDDRVTAKMTHADVTRIESHVRSMQRNRGRLVNTRDRLIGRLSAQ